MSMYFTRRSALSVIAVGMMAGRVDADERFRALRDEAIKSIGWIAGNAYGRAAWTVLQNQVGEDGVYYKALVLLATPGADHRAEAVLNVARYREGFKQGEGQPYNEREAVSRLQRANQIIFELTEILKREHGKRR